MTPADIPSLVAELSELLAKHYRKPGEIAQRVINAQNRADTTGYGWDQTHALEDAAEILRRLPALLDALSPKEAELVKPPREYEVSKADAILAALPTTDGAGMQEACAQIADAAKDIWERERASETDNDSDWYLAGKRDCARDIAREIRALPLATPPTTDASERMREALNGVMVGGNHLAHVLIGKLGAGFAEKFPPETDPQEALRALCATDTFEIWCCWRTIMLARAKVSALPLFDEGRL